MSGQLQMHLTDTGNKYQFVASEGCQKHHAFGITDIRFDATALNNRHNEKIVSPLALTIIISPVTYLNGTFKCTRLRKYHVI